MVGLYLRCTLSRTRTVSTYHKWIHFNSFGRWSSTMQCREACEAQQCNAERQVKLNNATTRGRWSSTMQGRDDARKVASCETHLTDIKTASLFLECFLFTTLYWLCFEHKQLGHIFKETWRTSLDVRSARIASMCLCAWLFPTLVSKCISWFSSSSVHAILDVLLCHVS